MRDQIKLTIAQLRAIEAAISAANARDIIENGLASHKPISFAVVSEAPPGCGYVIASFGSTTIAVHEDGRIE